jgi:predicted RNA-binding Zn-ribbon protein involved in translation (DUF1610 family)
MKFKSFVLEDEDTLSKEELKSAEVCELECDTCEFETTTEEFVEGDICPECGEGVLISDDCGDDIDESNINQANWTKLKEFMKKQGSTSWEFDGDYETLKITFNDSIKASNAIKMSNKSYIEIGAFGDVSMSKGVITVELNDDAQKALGSK